MMYIMFRKFGNIMEVIKVHDVSIYILYEGVIYTVLIQGKPHNVVGPLKTIEAFPKYLNFSSKPGLRQLRPPAICSSALRLPRVHILVSRPHPL